jgi:hypothetical protein
MKASFVFIGLVYTFFIIAQGISFGFIFASLQLTTVLLSFFTAGAVFIGAAVAGYLFKNFRTLMKMFFGAIITELVIIVLFLILSLTGTIQNASN